MPGDPAPGSLLLNPLALVADYYENQPEPGNPKQAVSFGTSGHRGRPVDGSFTESHILAITQAICEHRRRENLGGPLFIGMDTHGVSLAAQRTAIGVLAGNGVEVRMQTGGGFSPTPVISHAILAWNRAHPEALADGIIITPSHNPPEDGGFKYNPPYGGPADSDLTKTIQDRANELLLHGNCGVRRLHYRQALRCGTTGELDFAAAYIEDLGSVIRFALIKESGIRIGVDPLGGASLGFWDRIAVRYGLNLEVVNRALDPTFGFMTLDHDLKIRMDCSSPFAMRNLVGLREKYAVAFGNDPDADRHGIVSPEGGLFDPNHFLAIAIHFLDAHRPQWPKAAWVGKTVVSSSLIDRVVGGIGRTLREVPVGFKWFAKDLFKGTCCFGGEESAGASFLRQDGRVWTTDKDGLIMGLLAAEITAVSGEDPARYLRRLRDQYGQTWYRRLDGAAGEKERNLLNRAKPAMVTETSLAGDPVAGCIDAVPGEKKPESIGGLKVSTKNGWFAARPSGTEDIIKLYAESYRSAEHLRQIAQDAAGIVGRLTGNSAFMRAELAKM